jgi:low temperature requirement protein LtrA
VATDKRTGPGRLLRNPDLPRQTSYLELFFDLSFIVGLTLLSARLFQHLDWTNIIQTVVLLAGLWWIWIATAWSTDWFNPTEPFIQRLVIGAMFAELLMAASVRQAFGDHGIFFASAYSAVHLGRGISLSIALRGHPLQRRTQVVAVWFCFSAIPWLVGAVLPPTPRLVLWLVAIGIDFTIAWFGWPIPRMGRISDKQLSILGEHLSDRYRQVFIIALGEIVLVSGVTLSNAGFDWLRVLAFVVAFGNAVLLWWIYLEPAVGGLGPALDRSTPRLAVSTAYYHLIMIAGTMLTAVGAEAIITRPTGRAIPMGGAILGGTALFLLGRNLLDLLINGRFAWSRVGGLVATIAVLPAVLALPPIGAALVMNLVLFAIAFVQLVRNRSLRNRAHAT